MIKIEKQINDSHYGEVIYDENGLLVCHYCGKGGFRALGHHVRQAHKDTIGNMRNYKIMYGLDVKKGILVEETRQRKSEAVKENGTIDNLKLGINHRFKKGSEGRTKDQVSEQTRRRLIKNIIPHGFGGKNRG
jgi:hypothetical protein